MILAPCQSAPDVSNVAATRHPMVWVHDSRFAAVVRPVEQVIEVVGLQGL